MKSQHVPWLYNIGCKLMTGSLAPGAAFTNHSLEHSLFYSPEVCEKSSRWLWKQKMCQCWCGKPRKHMCVTDRHDMTLAVKKALNPNTTNNCLIFQIFLLSEAFE